MNVPSPLRLLAAASLALALTTSPVLANRAETSPDAQVLTESFLAYHPDLKHRLAGIEALEAGDHEHAFASFRDAARYADKAAQAMVAEMLWDGVGTPQDRAAAYAWMDLAAERQYPSFLAIRERYWAALDADQQARAIDVGQAIYAEYGDDVAKPRLERLLRRGQRQVTGSRVGFVGALQIHVPGPAGTWTSIDGSTYYADRYWRPRDYFAWQDDIWRNPPKGNVEVGPLGTSAGEPD